MQYNTRYWKRCTVCKKRKLLKFFHKGRGSCIKCRKKNYEANREQILAAARAKWPNRKEYRREYLQKNKKHTVAREYEYRKHNPDIWEACQKRFHESRPGWKTRQSAEAHIRKKRPGAMPKWLTKAQYLEIEEWYAICAEIQWLSEEKLVVDHIVPLHGKEVCGLHVPWNLQILTNSENCKKGNKFPYLPK